MVRFRSMKLLTIIVATTVFATGCGGSDSSTTDEAVSEDASEDAAAPAEDSGVTVCEGCVGATYAGAAHRSDGLPRRGPRLFAGPCLWEC